MIGDSRYLPLKDKSVNCIVTSPPYWSLRKYDIPDLIWDGKEGCEHEWGDPLKIKAGKGNLSYGDSNVRWQNPIRDGKKTLDTHHDVIQGQFCLHCSVWKGQLGLEPTIDLYLKHLMQIMDECWRVLRDDGTMWVNLGDSYATVSGRQGKGNLYGKQPKFSQQCDDSMPLKPLIDLPQKSLCLIPERFAIEMVNRGWILRNKIIWAKPNCMPASVKDRFTVDFEPVFFFVKSRKYWFEQQYEPQTEYTSGGFLNKAQSKYGKAGLTSLVNAKINPQGRNRRCVWTISTQPYPESHFATFPEALIEPMIRAGCPKEICVKCGKAREKIYKSETQKNSWGPNKKILKGYPKEGRCGDVINREEIGLTDCGCSAGFRPGIVLDPFAGSGTTMRVVERLGRIGIGFDLAYQDLQDKRLTFVQKELLA